MKTHLKNPHSAISTLLIMAFILMVFRFEGYSRAAFIMDGGLLDAQLSQLYGAAERLDVAAIKKKLQEIVPEYMPQETTGLL